MTLSQLKRMHSSFLSEYNRAVIRRRNNIKKVMANQLNVRRKARVPNNATTPTAIKMKKKLFNTIYRSVMNKASDPKCGRWRKTKGTWGGERKSMKRQCRA
jgi:hypothetical protein